jgi:phospholipid/cholesterol/gamma-HCH transport system substrate-binding protein
MSMSRVSTRNFVVGLFVLTGLGAVAYLSLSVGGLTFSPPETITVYAAFDEIGGLKTRANVTISGVSVGEVRTITLDDDYRARVELALDSGFEYPIDTTASIMTNGLLGDRYVLLQLGGDILMLQDGEQLDFTESALLLERLIGKLIHNTDLGRGD